MTCKSCGNSFEGNYCNTCGEKVIVPRDHSFGAFANSMLQALTLADGKVLRTLWLMITRPGFVSAEISAGRTVRYLRPLTLFFALNLIYFLFPLIQLFSASLRTQLHGPFRRIMQDAVAHKMIDSGIRSAESFTLIYDQKTTGLAKLIVMLFVIIASLPLPLFYRRKGIYFMDHVGLMVELACFNLFVNAILLSGILALASRAGFNANDTVLTVIFLGTNLYFLLRSGFAFYRETGFSLAIKTIFMIVVLRAALEIYRALLFLLTMWSL